MRKQDARVSRLEQRQEAPQGDEPLTVFLYHGERQRLQKDDSGRVVFDYGAAVAAICDKDAHSV